MPGTLSPLTDTELATAAWYGFGDLGQNTVVIMTAIAMAESSKIPDNLSPGAAAGGAGAYGLWQIENNHPEFDPSFWTTGYKMPQVNARAARSIYDTQHYEAWSAYTNGSYKQFIGAAQVAVQATQGTQSFNNAASGALNPFNPIATAAGQASDLGTSGGPFAGLEGAMWMGGGAILIVLAIVMLNKQAGNPVGKTVGKVAKVAEVAAL